MGENTPLEMANHMIINLLSALIKCLKMSEIVFKNAHNHTQTQEFEKA